MDADKKIKDLELRNENLNQMFSNLSKDRDGLWDLIQNIGTVLFPISATYYMKTTDYDREPPER